MTLGKPCNPDTDTDADTDTDTDTDTDDVTSHLEVHHI